MPVGCDTRDFGEVENYGVTLKQEHIDPRSNGTRMEMGSRGWIVVPAVNPVHCDFAVSHSISE